MLWTRVTATTSPAALAALADTASTAILTALVVTGRQRHSARRQKNRPGFPHTKTTTATVTGPVEITSFQPETTIDQQPKTPPPGR
jgi:hypothetical protein